jgi:hypothetical protein
MDKFLLLGQTIKPLNYGVGTNNASLSTDELLGLVTFVLALVVLLYLVQSYLLGRIFRKAGIERWKAWTPIYNTWIMLKLGDQRGFWAILALVPFINIISAIYLIIAMYHIGLRFGKDGLFVLWAIFLPLVWMALLAFDDSSWAETSGSTDTTPPQAGTPTTRS